MKSFKVFLIHGFFLGLAFSSFGQMPDQLKLSELENTIYNDMKISGAPGAVIGVVRDGQIIYQKAFGLCNINTQTPVNNSTVFQIASVTKTFTATALLMSCEKNNIDINAPIGNIIKELSPNLSKITIHQLLSHNSGMLDYWPDNSECKGDLLQYFLNAGDYALFEEPGKVFSYSNNGYALAGLLLATLNKSSYPKAINDILTKPLKMTNTTFDLGQVTTDFFATGHINGKPTSPSSLTNPTLQPAGGLFSNLADMARFATCIMNNGEIESQQIISKEVLRKMMGKYQFFGIQYQYLSYPNSYYGYGLISYDYKGIDFIGHSGEAGNQNSLLAMAPKYKTAVVVFSNTGYYPFINSLEKAVDIFIPINEKPAQKTISKQDLSKFSGRYYISNWKKSKDDWINIELKNTKLQIVFADKRTFELTQYADNRFTFPDPNLKFLPEIGFFTNMSGEVKYLNYFWRTHVKDK
jgi:CubicO group peptidase (beta-lactamase class C family)